MQLCVFLKKINKLGEFSFLEKCVVYVRNLLGIKWIIEAGNAFTQQSGILEGIENVNTPTRLFLIPYSSFYLNSFAKEKAFGTLKGGLDLKYGLTDAFTLRYGFDSRFWTNKI